MIGPTLDIERSLWLKGHRYVCGIDEVGRGSWAGPLVAAGVILPQDFEIPKGLHDSKLVAPKLREELAKIIASCSVSSFIVAITPRQIDSIGLTKATNVAFRKVINHIRPKPHFTVIDAFYIKHVSRKRQQAIKDGDKICASIAAASIIAKVYRDNLMKKLSGKYPQYGFDRHVGYGTKLHQEAIKKFGFTNIHRRSYKLDFLIS